ncbi:MAG: ribonuclease domain-containing protein [Lachnospiraceae bacterium]|nr:ribonuclease domain-containing protein [Lachnospiraceae bacterium]
MKKLFPKLRLFLLAVLIVGLTITGFEGYFAKQAAGPMVTETVEAKVLLKKRKNKKARSKTVTNNRKDSGSQNSGSGKKDAGSSNSSSQSTVSGKADSESAKAGSDAALSVEKDGEYTSKEEVALYIYTYGKLPKNYITKREAEELGWSSSAGNLDEVAPGKSIGGNRFGNYEGQLPEKNGRKYFECDIDYTGGYRGAKRIIYSNDGLVYYTEDHYKTFEQLY